MPNVQVSITTAAVAVFTTSVLAQSVPDYPSKPVRVVVGSTPGGGGDVQTRMFAQKMSDSLKRQFVVDNRPGAADQIANAAVAKAAPDGYTLVSVSPTFTIGPALYNNLPYDTIKDFTPVSLVIKAPYLVLVHPALPARSVKELIALARAKPGALDIGTADRSAPHLAASYFASMANIKVTFVPYKSSGQIMVDVLAGQIPMYFGIVFVAMPHVKSGRLRALAVTSAERSTVLPELPTVSESGMRGYDVTTWNGWLAPAGTPGPIVEKLSAELARAAKSPDIVKKLAEEGGQPVGSTPEQFQQLISTEIPRWRKVVKETGMRVE